MTGFVTLVALLWSQYLNGRRTPWSVLERVRDFLPRERTVEKRMFGERDHRHEIVRSSP